MGASEPELAGGGRDGHTIGRYVLYDEIASGGMAAVHFGRLSGPVGFSRPVAIKRLHPHLAKDPEFVTMFLDEARLAARVRHPNVVPTLDVVAMENEVFIVMEYVQGESVSRLGRTLRRRDIMMPITNALAIVAGALHGLHAAHEARDEHGKALHLVHRDVSPQNILVGADGGVRVLDFGVAKAVGRLGNTRDGSLKGKVAYMAPEQIAGQAVTRRSDIYSACVVLWELLTGRRLYEADTEIELVQKVLGRIADPKIDPPSKYNSRVSKELDAIVLRGLSPLAEDRYATARELAQLLEKSGGLVSASELGEWVESLASEALSKRAARVHAIESGNSPSGDALAAEAAELGATPPSGSKRFSTDAETQVGDSNTAAGLSVARREGAKKSRRRAWSIGALVVLLVVGTGVWVGSGFTNDRKAARGGAADASGAAADSSGSAAAMGSSGGSAPAATSAAAASASPSTIASTGATPASSSSVATRSTISTGAAKVSHPPPPPPRPKTDDCDPPYTIDADGHKVYKRNCLK
jgi:serine/threonine-protein kinase